MHLSPLAPVFAASLLFMVLPSLVAAIGPARGTSAALAETTPEVFAEGAISTGDYESHIAFAPGDSTVYFLKCSPNFTYWTIVSSQLQDGIWSSPEVAPFSGRYRDGTPFITADGSRLYFISDRPVEGKQGQDLDIWMVELTDSGRMEPRHLDAPVNSPGNEWFPTIANDGTIYFSSDREGGKGATDIYRCRLVNGIYQEPENLGDSINTISNEFEPLIAPDQRYIIFMAIGRPDCSGSGDLYISYHTDSGWTGALRLDDGINSPALEIGPRLSHDGRYLYFTSTRDLHKLPLDHPETYTDLMHRLHAPGNGLGDIYRVPIETVLRD